MKRWQTVCWSVAGLALALVLSAGTCRADDDELVGDDGVVARPAPDDLFAFQPGPPGPRREGPPRGPETRATGGPPEMALMMRMNALDQKLDELLRQMQALRRELQRQPGPPAAGPPDSDQRSQGSRGGFGPGPRFRPHYGPPGPPHRPPFFGPRFGRRGPPGPPWDQPTRRGPDQDRFQGPRPPRGPDGDHDSPRASQPRPSRPEARPAPQRDSDRNRPERPSRTSRPSRPQPESRSDRGPSRASPARSPRSDAGPRRDADRDPPSRDPRLDAPARDRDRPSNPDTDRDENSPQRRRPTED